MPAGADRPQPRALRARDGMKAVMYHYVRPDDPSMPHFRHLRLDRFLRQLDEFAARYGFVSQEDFFRAVECGTPVRGVVLTFDDGFRDHYRYVWPCLRERGLWGIFYIPTGVYRKGKLLDVHRVHVLLGVHGGRKIHEALRERVSREMLSDQHVEAFRTQTYRTQVNDDPTRAVKRILNYYIRYEYRETVIDELVRLFLSPEQVSPDRYYLRPEEIRRMQEDGMLIGSHTVSHPVLSRLPAVEQRREIVESFAFLEAVTGGLRHRSFCYPYGGDHSFTAETERILEQNGCRFSFSVEPRDIAARDLRSRRQALPRYDCNRFSGGGAGPRPPGVAAGHG